MITHDFNYFKPQTVATALDILGHYGVRGWVLAGGTDLVAMLAANRIDSDAVDAVIDIKAIPELDGIAREEKELRLGALVTFGQLLDSELIKTALPMVWEMATTVATHAIRNRATVAGNLCSAVPCCDAGPALLVCDASVRVVGPSGERVIALADWFRGPRCTALEPDEMVTAISVPLDQRVRGASFVKLRRYAGADLAQSSVAVAIAADQQYRVAFGAVAPTPFRAHAIEKALADQPIGEAQIASASAMVADVIRPITDIRATRAYRIRTTRVMFERALAAAWARCRGDGPAYGTALL